MGISELVDRLDGYNIPDNPTNEQISQMRDEIRSITYKLDVMFDKYVKIAESLRTKLTKICKHPPDQCVRHFGYEESFTECKVCGGEWS